MSKNKQNWLLYLSLGFLLLILFFNWPHYIDDTDDPLTIAYHFWGRNNIIQSPYNIYDSMCDYILSFLPRNYAVLYTSMVLWTFVSAVAVFILIVSIAKSFRTNFSVSYYLAGFILLLAIPEFDYLLLSYKSSIIGFSFILLSHQLLIRNYNKTNATAISSILISAILFAFGVTCRWSLVTYGLAIIIDFAYIQYQQTKPRKIWMLPLWCLITFLCFSLFISISGYSIHDFIGIISWGKNMIRIHQNQSVYNLATASTLFTPTSVLFLFAGIIAIVKNFRRNKRLAIYIISSYLPYIYLTFIPNLKFLITLFPAIALIIFTGIEYINTISTRRLKFANPALVALILLPWFIGIQVYSDTTLWGPGFDIKNTTSAAALYNRTLDQRFSIDHISIKPAAGFAISSTEGNRPLWGYFYTLFCGKLYDLDKKIVLQAQKVIELCAKKHIPIYTDYASKMNPSILDVLCRNDFQTTDSEMCSGEYTQRTFTKGNDTVTIRAFNHPEQTENFEKLKQLFPNHQFIAAFTYSSLLTDFMYKAPSHGITIIKRLDAFSCLCR